MPAEQIADNKWVEILHPYYLEKHKTWDFIESHYDGSALDIARKKAIDQQRRGISYNHSSDGRVKGLSSSSFDDHPILWRRISTESEEQFVERAFTSRFPRVMAFIVDSFAGSIEAVEAKDTRTFDDIWKGPPENEASELYNFWQNADGENTNFPALIRRQSSTLTKLHRVWCLVETDKVVFWDIKNVVNWRFEGDQLVEVVVRELVDGRASIKNEHAQTLRYVHYHLDGWDRYEVQITADGVQTIVRLPGLSGLWKFPHFASSRDKIENNFDALTLPINYFDLDLNGFPGKDLAEGANYLFNLLSDARNILRQSNYPYWVGDVDDTAFLATIDAVRKGWNMLQGKWSNQGPSAENARMAFEVFKQETEQYFVEMHQILNTSDNTQADTATKVKTEDSRGRQSFLQTQARALEEIENWIWFMLTQKRYPTRPDVWDGTSVKRSRDFEPINTKEWAQSLIDSIFGTSSTVPTGEAGMADAAKKILRLLGVEFDDSQVESAVRLIVARQEAETERGTLENQRLQLVNENESNAGLLQARENAIRNAPQSE